MPTNLNKKMLDLKTWDMCTPCPVATAANTFVIGSDGPDQGLMHVVNATTVWWYSPLEDGWVQLASPALAGTFGTGVCGGYHPQGPSGTAQAGTGAGVLVTNLTLLADLSPKLAKKFAGRITAGTGAGQDFMIGSNTTGVNSICYITKPDGSALAVAPDTTSVYVLYTGRFYILNAGTVAAGSFKAYDHATQNWLTLGITGLPATWANDGRIAGTPGNAKKFATGTATAGGATTLTNTAKAWAVNQWANFQARITAGTGAGQVRRIANNTGTVLTVATAWTVNPDATSQYAIEGDDDALYLIGNGGLSMYKYSISGNTFVLVVPAVARGGVAGVGANLHWVFASDTPNFDAENAIVNGRRLYSFRGAGGNLLDVFDIAANSWSTLTYGRQNEGVNAGASWGYDGVNRMICQISPVAGAPARFVAYDVRANNLQPIGALLYAPSTVVLGDKASVLEYDDGVGAPLKVLYQMRHSGTEMHRVELF